MPFDPVTAAFEIGGKLLDRFLPDPEKKAAAQLELAKMAENGDLARMTNETETVKAFLADTASARDRDRAFLTAGKKNYRGDILAYAAMGALSTTILLLLFVPNIPETSEKLLYVVLGALIAIVKDVYGFEFGSSKDSQRNAQAVSDMLKGG